MDVTGDESMHQGIDTILQRETAARHRGEQRGHPHRRQSLRFRATVATLKAGGRETISNAVSTSEKTTQLVKFNQRAEGGVPPPRIRIPEALAFIVTAAKARALRRLKATWSINREPYKCGLVL